MSLVPVSWVAGSDEACMQYMANVTAHDKVALLSHVADLDGVVSAKIACQVVTFAIVQFVDYDELNALLLEMLRNAKVTKIIMLDLGISNLGFIHRAEEFAEVLIIDHHRFSQNPTSSRTTFMNARGYTAAYLCYYLFSRLQSMDHFDWLVACTALSDWLFTENAAWLAQVYEKYGQIFDIQQVKQGPFWEMQYALSLAIIYYRPQVERVMDALGGSFGSIGNLASVAVKVQRDIDRAIERFAHERNGISEGYFWELEERFPIKDMVINVVSAEQPDKTFIFVSKRGAYCLVSARRQDKKVNLPVFLGKLVEGFAQASAGGHIVAAGAAFLVKDMPLFKRRLGYVHSTAFLVGESAVASSGSAENSQHL